MTEILASSSIVIDRPKGTRHPKIDREVLYPLDYGYLSDTTSPDGDGIDVFVGSAAGAGIVAVVVTADPVKRDVEIKLLVDCSAEEVETARTFLTETLGIGGAVLPLDRPG
ncbi:inorganic diphosphatase [Streptomyces sp. NPDC057433]|uniref:inorganic diphosphatase n=1 Tax=Streptomyces sp. NPDC057433 TaxID=3346132 RepID=UPI0036C72C54